MSGEQPWGIEFDRTQQQELSDFNLRQSAAAATTTSSVVKRTVRWTELAAGSNQQRPPPPPAFSAGDEEMVASAERRKELREVTSDLFDEIELGPLQESSFDPEQTMHEMFDPEDPMARMRACMLRNRQMPKSEREQRITQAGFRPEEWQRARGREYNRRTQPDQRANVKANVVERTLERLQRLLKSECAAAAATTHELLLRWTGALSEQLVHEERQFFVRLFRTEEEAAFDRERCVWLVDGAGLKGACSGRRHLPLSYAEETLVPLLVPSRKGALLACGSASPIAQRTLASDADKQQNRWRRVASACAELMLKHILRPAGVIVCGRAALDILAYHALGEPDDIGLLPRSDLCRALSANNPGIVFSFPFKHPFCLDSPGMRNDWLRESENVLELLHPRRSSTSSSSSSVIPEFIRDSGDMHQAMVENAQSYYRLKAREKSAAAPAKEKNKKKSVALKSIHKATPQDLRKYFK